MKKKQKRTTDAIMTIDKSGNVYEKQAPKKQKPKIEDVASSLQSAAKTTSRNLSANTREKEKKQQNVKIANKNYNEKLSVYNKASETYQKKRGEELRKRNVDLSSRSTIDLEPYKNKILNYATKQEDIKTPQQRLIERAEKQQPLIEEANKATEKEKEAVSKAKNDYVLAKYQKNVADVDNKDIGVYDKTLGAFLTGVQDIGSNFVGDNKYTDENGNTVYLPNKAELTWQKTRDSYGDNVVGKLARFGGDVAHEGGKIAATGLVNAATGGIGGSALYFSDIFGDQYKQNINEGYSEDKAGQDALLKTGQNYIKQRLIGGLGGKLTGTGPSWLEKSLTNTWSKAVSNPVVSKTLASMSSEAIDEFTDEWIESAIDSAVLGKDFDPMQVFKESLYSGAIGGATGAFGGIGDRVNTSLDENRLALQELNTIADQRIQQLQQEVQQDPSRAQEAVQEIEDIQRYVQAQANTIHNQTQTQAQESETTQPNAITQETQNVAQREKLPTNTTNKIQNFRNSVANENVNDADGFYKSVEKIIKDKDYNVILDSSITNEQGNPVSAVISNENGITIRINPKSERAGEILLTHEITHGIETKEMSKLIMDYASKNSKFNDALESLKKTYGTEDITPEVVADISGQLLGNQEFIKSLSTQKPNIFKQIYDKIIEIANKLTGNSNQKLFIKDLKNKWEKAYRESNIQTAQQNLKEGAKYSQNAEITDNKGRPLNINMQNYMENSQATNDKGELVTLYHTTTDMIKQFNIFDPANKYDPSEYKFGKYNVTYLTDGEEMSESYSMYEPRKADTRRLHNIKEAEEYLENTSLRLVDIENTNQAIKNHFKNNKNRYFLVSGDLTTFGEYKTEEELLRDLIPTAQQVMRGDSNYKYEVYANITKPFIIDANGNNWNKVAREINEESKKIVDSLTDGQKKELYELANESLDKWQEWHMSDDYMEYKKYDDIYKSLSSNEQENLILLSMKDNFTAKDYEDVYKEYGKEFGMKDPDSKIELNPYGEVKMQRNYKDFVAEWCRLENESSKYNEKYSYFMSKANKKYNNQLRNIGVDKLFDIAKYDFKDWAIEDTLSKDLETNDVVRKVIEMNEKGEDYDGVIIKNTTDYGVRGGDEVHDVYVVFNSNQLKSVDNPNPTDDPDIRYSQKVDKWQQWLNENFPSRGTTTVLKDKINNNKTNKNVPATKNENVISEEAKQQQEKTKQTNENVNTNPNKQSRVQNDVIAERITNNINNAIKGKDVFEEVEETTGKPIRRGIKTITTATGTTQLVSTMDDSIITYDPQSNESTLNKAREAQKGMTLDEKYQDCLDFINSDKRIKAVDIAKIELTLKELQLKGDAEKFSNLVQYAATLGTTDAQALQMMSVIKKMNPMSQLETLQKLIQKEQSKGNKIYDGVKINQELVKKVLDTQNANGEVNQDQFYEAMEDLKNDIAKQMKSTAIDKVNSFRYLAMLGNPKTHIRNVVGNGFMFGLQSFKDVIGTVGEVAYDTTLKATGKEGMQERTKTFKTASKEVREYVNKKVDDFFSKNKTTNKYNESMKGLSGDLESRRNIFSNNNVIGRALNKASSINNSALDKMDNFFSSAMTKKAMKNYLTANGIRTNAQIESNPEMVARALDYALFKGKEATFHQDSKTASIIRNAREQARTGSGYTKAVGLAVDATMPFVSTPVNIAKTAMEYTPVVGLGDLNTQLKNSPKEIRGAVIIDHISKQFAGLSLLCLGMGLAASGKIKGAGEGDKEDKTEKNLGNAQYSIKFGNNTYDLSWISPSAVPLFEGVEIYNKYAKNKDVNVGAMVDTFFGALNPVTDMSVLQSIERTLTTLAYGKNAVQSLGETTFSSYLSQYIPTLSSQFAQWFDTKQRNSNTGSNALEKTFDQIKYKIPATTEFTGVGKWLNKNLTRKSLPENVDIWGEENKTAENFWQRGFEAFLSPANRKEYKVDSTTKELERLARETDDTAVLPTSKDKSVKINGEEHELKGKDFVDLQKTYGKTAKKNLDELIKSDSYKKASDAEKKSMVGKLYDYATYKAKENYAKNKDINFDSGKQTSFAMIDAFKIPYEKYVENKVSGNESTTKILNKLNEAGFSEIQKGAVMNYYDRPYYVDEEKLYNTLKNSGLSNKQKELIKARYKKNITDSERERYKRADNMGIDYGLYTNFRSFVSNTKGESRTGGLTKKQKVINWIQKQKLSAKQKQNLYDDYINNQRTFSYYK